MAEAELWQRRNYGRGGIMTEAELSQRQNYGGGVMAEVLWIKNYGRGIMVRGEIMEI